VGIRHADHVAPSIRKFGTNFADKQRSLGRYSSLADSDNGFLLSFFVIHSRFVQSSRLHVSQSVDKCGRSLRNEKFDLCGLVVRNFDIAPVLW
jgi:hypothetical protein